MSYAEAAPKLAQAARKAGHEVLVHVPMEPEGKVNPGPHALTTEQTREAFDQQLTWDLDRFEGYVGINNHMGSRVTASTERMSWLFEELERRGLMFVDFRTTKETVAPMLAKHFGLPFAERDVFLDNEFDADAVEAQLQGPGERGAEIWLCRRHRSSPCGHHCGPEGVAADPGRAGLCPRADQRHRGATRPDDHAIPEQLS